MPDEILPLLATSGELPPERHTASPPVGDQEGPTSGQVDANTIAAPSPTASGPAGSAFESKVGAACLTLLLARGSPLFLGTGTLQAVHLQAGHLGWRTDDILLQATDRTGHSVKAALQAKRAFTLQPSDEESAEALRGALADFRNVALFDQTRDKVGIVTSSLSAKLARVLRTLLDCARASTSAPDMVRRLAIPGYLGKSALGYHNSIREILADADGGVPSDDELWKFLSSFDILDLDLNIDGGLTETMMSSLLTATLRDGDPSVAQATWNELLALALSDAGRAMSYTRATLPSALLARHGEVTGYSTGVSKMLEDTKVVVDGVRTTISDTATIPRLELSGKLSTLIAQSSLVLVTGPAGSGKSALVKSAFSVTTNGGIGIAFRAVSLTGRHINEVLHRFGMTIEQLRAQTSMHGRKILWVESMERLLETPPDQRAAFLDLLRTLKSDATWCLVVTCRDYSAETVRSAFFSEIGWTPATIEVGDLSDPEVGAVARIIPSLSRPLRSQSLRRLLKNPFFLDMAAKMAWPETEPLPTNERTFRDKVWNEVVRKVGVGSEIGMPQLRAQAMVGIALKRAQALEQFVAGTEFGIGALHSLVVDSLLLTPAPDSALYAPAHDVFEDWALMNRLDDEFLRQGRQLDALVNSLGAYPALRRAYRKWLTESLNSEHHGVDTLALAFIQNPTIAPHWREDTLVGLLQSADAIEFLLRNSELLLADSAKLLRQVIHLLRVACRAAVPFRLFGLDSEGEIYLPKGNGWIGAAELMEAAVPLFTPGDFLLLAGFLDDWVLLTKWGVAYPRGASSIARIAWHLLRNIPRRQRGRGSKTRLFKVILSIPFAAEPELSRTIDEILGTHERRFDDEELLELIFNHFACDAVVRDLPDLAFRVAERLLGLDLSLEEIIADRPNYGFEAVNSAFGLGGRHRMHDFPASAYHGPWLRMLSHHPSRGLDFIIRFINRACEAYSHPDNRYEFIEPPGIVRIQLPDGSWYEQIGNSRLWQAFRGASVTPECFQSALMALEHWLLEKAKQRVENFEGILVDLLRRSNNVALTAVVASVAVAHPIKAGEAGFSILTCRPLLRADLHRGVQDGLMPGLSGQSILSAMDAEKGIYEKERAASARLPHRKANLESVAFYLQATDAFRERVWNLIDSYKAELPPVEEQDRETKLWRIQLHRIDTRNLVVAGETEEGHTILDIAVPEQELQSLIEAQQPRTVALESAMRIFSWGRNAFDGRLADIADADLWREHLGTAQQQLASGYGAPDQQEPGGAGPVFVAVVCVRDHWSELTQAEQDWCARTICDAVEADADTTDHFAIGARSLFEGSRPAAFILPSLFDKSLPPVLRARLLPALAKATMHSVEETVVFAIKGIARFLWTADRALALTCIQAVVTQALEEHGFLERQRGRSYLDGREEAFAPFKSDLRSRMRRFIAERSASDESQIVSLDLTRWPGRAVAKYLFEVAIQNPNDRVSLQIASQCARALPAIWEAAQLGRGRSESRYDHEVSSIMVDAVCRFVLNLAPADAVTCLQPIIAVASQFPKEIADVVMWLVVHQGDRAPAPTLWALWQRFADNFVEGVDSAKVDEEYSDEAKLLHQLFLGENWQDARDWLPLHGETHRCARLFEQLPPMKRAFDYYSYYLAKTGTPTLPDALEGVASKLPATDGHTILSEIAVFHLEEVLRRQIYGGNVRLRIETPIRQAAIKMLDALIAAGSSAAYKLRDDFLTPFPA